MYISNLYFPIFEYALRIDQDLRIICTDNVIKVTVVKNVNDPKNIYLCRNIYRKILRKIQ